MFYGNASCSKQKGMQRKSRYLIFFVNNGCSVCEAWCEDNVCFPAILEGTVFSITKHSGTKITKVD